MSLKRCKAVLFFLIVFADSALKTNCVRFEAFTIYRIGDWGGGMVRNEKTFCSSYPFVKMNFLRIPYNISMLPRISETKGQLVG